MRTMKSISESFDGFFVIHAPRAQPERETIFTNSMRELGIQNYIVMEAPLISDDDPRITNYSAHRNIPGLLSLMDAQRLCIEHALKSGWKSLMIFESDFIVRPGFHWSWKQISSAVEQTKWDFLLLYRWHFLPIIELPLRTKIKRIRFSYCAHGMAMRREFFKDFLVVSSLMMQYGKSHDSRSAFRQYRQRNVKVYATTRNLLGQSAEVPSGISKANRYPNLFSEFRVGNLHDRRWQKLFLRYMQRKLKSKLGGFLHASKESMQ